MLILDTSSPDCQRSSLPGVLLIMLVALGAQLCVPTSAEAQAVVSGMVRSEAADRPLPGARIRVTREGGSPVLTVSDANGRFTSATAGSGPLSLEVTKAGYAPLRLSVPAANAAALDIRLTPGAVVTGRVIDAAGVPAPFVELRFRRNGDDGRTGGPWLRATSNDLGEYRLGSLSAGTYQVGQALGGLSVARAALSVVADALPPDKQTITTVELHAGQETAFDITRAATPALPTAAVEAATRQATAAISKMLGGEPVDPATAGQVAGAVSGIDATSGVGGMVRLVPQNGAGPLIAPIGAGGRYEFPAVPPGAYRVVAQGPGTAEAEYGATPANRAGQWVTVRARQRVDRIDITLPRASAIAGRIVDGYGEPLEGLQVQAWRVRTQGGRPVLEQVIDAPGASMTTDDRGSYRLAGFIPGRYFIVASEPAPPAAVPTSAKMQEVVTFALGAVLGQFASPTTAVSFYPGRGTAGEASAVTVDTGIDVLGVDMTFAPATGVPVSGVVLRPDGTPLQAQLTLSVSRRSGAPSPPPYRVSSQEDGTFTIPLVVPGEYVLQAEQQRPGDLLGPIMSLTGSMSGGAITGVAMTGGGRTTDMFSTLLNVRWTADTVPLFATTFVQVTGAGAAPVTLRTSTGATVTGRVTFDGPSQPPSPTAFGVGFAPADSDLTRSFVPSSRVNADGTFEAIGLIGPTRLIASSAPDGWWLKSATVAGVNAVDAPATFSASPASEQVDVVFSSARSGVGGRVLTATGSPVAGATVLIFPSDWTRWHPGTRYVRQAAAQQGRFELAALSPGRYMVVAIDAASASAAIEWQDQDLLTRLMPLAQEVTVREGNLADVRLTVADIPR